MHFGGNRGSGGNIGGITGEGIGLGLEQNPL